MRVLFLSTWFPYPADNGSRIRVYNLLKALGKRHEVHLISLLQDDSDPSNAVHLQDICEVRSMHKMHWFNPGSFKSFLGYFSSRPRSFIDAFDPSIKQAVLEAAEQIKPDVIVASTLGVAEYVPYHLGIPRVLEQHNCEYAFMKRSAEKQSSALARMRYGMGWKKFARWESRICRSFDAVVMVSEQDRIDMLLAAPDLKNLDVVTNGVDTKSFDPALVVRDPNMLLYNGALTYRPNLEAVRYFASEIYPLIRAKQPEVKLVVTGRTTGVDLTGIDDCPGIDLVGYVQDMKEVLYKSSACIVPLFQGGGSRLKILEAMAAGVPVISTPKGAEGIDCEDGKHIILATTPERFASAIQELISDQNLADSITRAARELVVESYDWSELGEKFTGIVEAVSADRKSS